MMNDITLVVEVTDAAGKMVRSNELYVMAYGVIIN